MAEGAAPTSPSTDLAASTEAAGGFQFRQAIVEMVRRSASDLLLKAGRPPTIRVNGALQSLDQPPLRPEQLTALAESLMTPTQRDDFAKTREADFGIGVPEIGRFRANVYQQRGTVAFALRAIPYEVRTIRELLLPDILERLALTPRGLVLVTGRAGSGKSTTLAAMIEHLNRHRRVNVITVEDPIEFLHRDQLASISQREVGSDTLSFGAALRHVLRQDPDVILIGEIRDRDTMDTALKAADTGHLVLSTIHTTDAMQTLSRVLSFYPSHQHDEIRMLLSTALAGVVSLRLVPRADGTGRVPAVEVLVNSAAVADNIRDTQKALNIPDLIAEGGPTYGMQSFDQSLMRWYQDGAITYDEALFHASHPAEFMLRASGISAASDRTFDDLVPGSQ